MTSGAVLGISADFHDAAAAVILDGTLVAAAAEERFTRVKHDPSLPVHATKWCLSAAGVESDGLDLVVFYEKPLTVLERILSTHARVGPVGLPQLTSAISAWASSKAWIGYRIERMLKSLGYRLPDLAYAEHHQSHAAAAFYPSPFRNAAIVTLDGVGEWTTATIGTGDANQIHIGSELKFPDSLGLLYSTITAHCGFEVNDGEYKLMGLAPYGQARYIDTLRDHLITIEDDGSFRLNQRWFGFRAGREMAAPKLVKLLGPSRSSEDPIQQRHADLARSIQVLLEDVVLRIISHAFSQTEMQNLCLAGGVALNCVANGRVMREGRFNNVWVQPAAGDDGGAVGAALWGWHSVLGHERTQNGCDAMFGAALGPSFEQPEISEWLSTRGVQFRTLSDGDLHEQIARDLAEGKVVGWFRGRMEFGPRALGHRSILADPRDATMVSRINLLVKGREGFRPFAPSVLAEEVSNWFDIEDDLELPYMTATVGVRGAVAEVANFETSEGTFAERLTDVRSAIPACTHVDGSARVQTVSKERSPDFHRLLTEFHHLTACPILLNTSFNRRGEPIVCTPADALECFQTAGLDLLVLENCVIRIEDVQAGSAAIVP